MKQELKQCQSDLAEVCRLVKTARRVTVGCVKNIMLDESINRIYLTQHRLDILVTRTSH